MKETGDTKSLVEEDRCEIIIRSIKKLNIKESQHEKNGMETHQDLSNIKTPEEDEIPVKITNKDNEEKSDMKTPKEESKHIKENNGKKDKEDNQLKEKEIQINDPIYEEEDKKKQTKNEKKLKNLQTKVGQNALREWKKILKIRK